MTALGILAVYLVVLAAITLFFMGADERRRPAPKEYPGTMAYKPAMQYARVRKL